MSVGKALYIGSYLIELGGLGKLASGGHFSLIAFFVLGVVLVGHLLSENHFLPSHIYVGLIVRLGFLVNILVQQGAPTGDEQAVRVVLGSRHSLQMACGD